MSIRTKERIEKMSFIEAIILGIVQGLAEFLPVSSSGHLALFKKLFGLSDVGLTFDLMLHFGTLVAVFIVYWKDIWELIKEGVMIIVDAYHNIVCFFKKDKRAYKKIISTPYRRFVMLIIVSTIPTGIIGLLFKKIFNMDNPSLLVVGLSLLITACLLYIVDELPDKRKKEDKVSYKDAVIVGVSQGIATLPGLSRSGTTITIERLLGFDRKFAVKYSFIMSIPAILGANILDIKDLFEPANAITGSELMCYIAGTVVAGVVGFICIKAMLVLIKNKKFRYFSYYCAIVGCVAIIANFVI